MRARIYRPAKNAMQSGKARTKQWLLEYRAGNGPHHRSADGLDLVRRHAPAGARWSSTRRKRRWPMPRRNAIPYQLFEPHVPTPKPKAYSDNFRFDRKVPWSH